MARDTGHRVPGTLLRDPQMCIRDSARTNPFTNLPSRPATANRAPEVTYRNNRNKLSALSTAVLGFSETVAETSADTTQNAATKCTGAKCRRRSLLIQIMNPPSAPTARKTQRSDMPAELNGKSEPARRKAPIIRGKNTSSNRLRPAKATCNARIVPR